MFEGFLKANLEANQRVTARPRYVPRFLFVPTAPMVARAIKKKAWRTQQIPPAARTNIERHRSERTSERTQCRCRVSKQMQELRSAARHRGSPAESLSPARYFD